MEQPLQARVLAGVCQGEGSEKQEGLQLGPAWLAGPPAVAPLNHPSLNLPSPGLVCPAPLPSPQGGEVPAGGGRHGGASAARHAGGAHLAVLRRRLRLVPLCVPAAQGGVQPDPPLHILDTHHRRGRDTGGRLCLAGHHAQRGQGPGVRAGVWRPSLVHGACVWPALGTPS